MHRRIVPVVACLVAAVTAVRAQVQPVLSIPYDADFNGVGPKGTVAGTPIDKPELVPGKFGKALKTGPTFGYVDYPTEGVLSRAGGTVEMWVCPLDWPPADEKFHVFFETKGEGALYLYKYWVGTNLLMLTCDNRDGPFASSQAPTASWQVGEWHHIAGTWSHAGVMAYVDGKPASKVPLPGALPKALGATFQIGDRQWQFPRTTASLVDDVRIYDRALTPAHIAAHAAGDYRFTLPLTAETATLGFDIDSAAGTVAAQLDSGGADADDARLGARLAIVPKGGSLPATAAAVAFSQGQASWTGPLPSRTPGQYEVVAAVLLDGKPAFEVRRDLVIPTTEWLGSQLGREDKVLPPWTPMTVAGTTINCWGRSYDFDQAVLPTQIGSAGAELLSRPVALRLVSGGQEIAWTECKAGVDKASTTRVELTGAAGLTQGDQRGDLTSHIVAEYDGLLVIELLGLRPDALAPDTISLEVPVRAEHAIYRHRYGPTWMPTSGNVPPGDGVVDKTAFVPFAWLGDNDRGLFWFCESDEMWPNAKAENAIEIVRAGTEIVLRLNLLVPGQKLPTDWRFVFGLQATPVKPIPKDWRKWRMDPGRNPNIRIVWPTANKQDSLKYFGYPEAADPAAFATHIRELHAKGLKAVPYLCLTWVTDAIPEWQYFRPVWDMGAADPSIPEAGWKHGFRMVSPVGPGYSDFMMCTTKAFLDRYGIDGVYHDQTHPYTSRKVQCGVGYRRDGKEYIAYPILGYRALYRRDYAVVKSLPRETFTMAHMSGKVTVPILAYDDSYLDGEHFRGVVKESYLDVTTLDAFRCEYMGRQWGMMPFFLPEFPEGLRDRVEPTRGLMALLMLHDVGVWPIWCNKDVVNEALAALDAFGYVDAEFLPYFSAAPPATTETKDVLVSGYRRPDGRALLVVANLAKEDWSGPVRLSAAGLGMKAVGEVLAWPDKTSVPVKDAVVEVTVPRLGYGLLVAAPAP